MTPAAYVRPVCPGVAGGSTRHSRMFSIRSVRRFREREEPRWAYGIDPRLHSRDVTRREDRRRERKTPGKVEANEGCRGRYSRDFGRPGNVPCPSLMVLPLQLLLLLLLLVTATATAAAVAVAGALCETTCSR